MTDSAASAQRVLAEVSVGVRVRVHPALCEGWGNCHRFAAAVYPLGADGYLDLVRALPGVVRVESAKVWPKEDGSPTPAHRVVDAYFADYDAACAAVRTQAAGALFPETFRLGTGGVTVLFSDVEVDR